MNHAVVRRPYTTSATALAILLLFLSSCSDGALDPGPENTVQLDGGPQVTAPVIPDIANGNPQAEIFQYGIVTSLKNIPNATESVVTASFIGFQQEVIRPDRDEEQAGFIEECNVDVPITDPLNGLLGTVQVTVGGNISAGDELTLNDDTNTPLLPMEKIIDETLIDNNIGYVGRIPGTRILPEALFVDIPGDEFPNFPKVTIPPVDDIEGFTPEPGTAVNETSSFTWTSMNAEPEQGIVVMDIGIVSDNYTINCLTFDDGAFSISDAAAFFEDDAFDGAKLTTVSRRTRQDTESTDRHVIANAMTFIGIEKIVDETVEVFHSSYLGNEVVAMPPELTDPVLYELNEDFPTVDMGDIDGVGCSGLVHQIDIPAGQDAFISMASGSDSLQYPLWVTGGDDVHIQGLEFRTSVQPGCDVGQGHQVDNDLLNIHPRLPGSAALSFSQSGHTYIEGVDIDLAGQEADCFSMRNPLGNSAEEASNNRNVSIVNSSCMGVEGLDSSPIGDGISGGFFQNHEGANLNSLILDTVTYRTSGDGISLYEGNGFNPGRVSLRRVNFGVDTRFSADDVHDESTLAFDIVANEVFSESVYLDNPDGLNYGTINGERVGAFELPGYVSRADGMFEGQPTIGDFALPEHTGLEYAQALSSGGIVEGFEPPPLDLANVRWLHTDISDWPVSASIGEVTVTSSQVCMPYDMADTWPALTLPDIGNTPLVGNPWVFIYNQSETSWYAATWEWLRPGQTCKARTSLNGDHIRQSPYSAASGWRPLSGETLYFMVSGLARTGARNVQVRTEPVKVIWR